MLTLRHYESRLELLEIQFEFLRHAVGEMPKASLNRFFKSKRNQRITALEAGVSIMEQQVGFSKDLKHLLLKSGQKLWSKEFGPKNHYFYKQFALDDLNRSELLLLIAHFESCLKEIHRQLILADPRRPFAKSNGENAETQPRGEISVWKIFQPGYENFLSSTFFTNLVTEEVERADRLPMDERFKYLEKHFKLGFMKHKEEKNETIKALVDLSNLRNVISHRIMEAEAVTHVSAVKLQEARKLFREVPKRLVALAANVFPKHFK